MRWFELDGVWFKVCDEVALLFKNAGWGPIFQQFDGYNLSWCYDFIHSFDGNRAQIIGMEFTVIEDSIIESTGFPTEGEKWFDKLMMQTVELNFFLKGEHHNPNWSMGIPQNMLNF